MSTAGLRSAQAAVDGARAAVERLEDGRHPEENAADLVEAWESAQNALRALTGTGTLGGNALIREASQRQLLSLDQAHALVAFSAAAERARDPSYSPTSSDLGEARAGFHLLEAAVAAAPVTAGSSRSSADPSDASAEGARSSQLPPPAQDMGTVMSPLPSSATPRTNLLARGIVVVALLLVIAAGAYYAFAYRSRVGHLRKAVAAYSAGDRATARLEFTEAARANPRSAAPHIYLARMAREEGDAMAAGRELSTALSLEPENAVALREMGAHLLALGNLDLARRFYVRAVDADPKDRLALGYLSCTLARLGRYDEARRFLDRAGPGEWSACVAAVTPPPMPGTTVPPGVPK